MRDVEEWSDERCLAVLEGLGDKASPHTIPIAIISQYLSLASERSAEVGTPMAPLYAVEWAHEAVHAISKTIMFWIEQQIPELDRQAEAYGIPDADAMLKNYKQGVESELARMLRGMAADN